MSKLGYTWYPKDFISDPEVMMMSAEERSVYRDLIDLAMLNDNKIKFSLLELERYTNAKKETIQNVLELKGKKHKEFWSIPSCQKRLNKASVNRDNGNKGGRPKKPKQNPELNPNKTQDERQIEIEKKEKYNKENFLRLNTEWRNQLLKHYEINLEEYLKHLDVFELQADMNREELELKKHFYNWLKTRDLKKTRRIIRSFDDMTPEDIR